MNSETQKSVHTEKPRTRLRAVLAGVTAVVILAGSLTLAAWFMMNRPKATRRQPVRMAPVVLVAPLTATNMQVRIEAMGTVVAAEEVALQAEVSGKIVEVAPALLEGHTVTNGAVLVRIDARNYRLALAQAEAALEQARSQLLLEQGRQDIARQEWALLGTNEPAAGLDRELALRGPQLRAAEAAVNAAQAARDLAAVNLERTRVTAPFNAMVASESADVGDQAMPGAVLARLVGTDRCHVRVTVPRSDLKWLTFAGESPSSGSEVRVRLSSGTTRNGRLVSLLPELEPQGRLARVLVEVPNPFGVRETGDGGPEPLLLGDFVGVVMIGETVPDAVRIPRAAMREGRRVWLMDSNERLKIVTPRRLWETEDAVYAEDTFEAGSRLVISDLATPVAGMTLSLMERKPDSQRGGPPSDETEPETP